MKSNITICVVLVALLGMWTKATAEEEINWLTGEHATWFGISPHVHAYGAFGGSTEDPADLANGHHDPNRDGANLQTLELGTSVRWFDYFEAFGVYSMATDSNGNLDGDWEEYFAKIVNIPGGFELRGGQFYNRFGFQNAVHNHSWNYVDQNLVNGLLLQEGELATRGGDVTWNLPTPFTSALTVSYGEVPSHDHGAHEHEESHGIYDAEGANFTDMILGGNYVAKFNTNDFHQMTLTLSGATGDNGYGRTSQVYGIGFEYLWRENGLERGGDYFRWRTEAIGRYVQAQSGGGHDEHGHEDEHGDEHDDHDEETVRGSYSDFGIGSEVGYGFLEHFEAALRGEYVTGASEAGLEDRWRVSPAVSWYLNNNRTLQARLQYNLDGGDDMGTAHSVWLQFGFNWGGAEVR